MGVSISRTLSDAYDAWAAVTSEAAEDVRRLVRTTLEAVEQQRIGLDVGHGSEHSGCCSHPVARAFDRVVPLSALVLGRNGPTLEPVEASFLLDRFGPEQDPPRKADPAETQAVAEWLESLTNEAPPPEPEYISPPLSEDELVVVGHPDLAAALQRWREATAHATWTEQAHYWLSLVQVVEQGNGNGLFPKDGGPPLLQAFSSLAHELWRVGKAERSVRPEFADQRLKGTVGRVGALIMLRNFGELKSGPSELPPIPETR